MEITDGAARLPCPSAKTTARSGAAGGRPTSAAGSRAQGRPERESLVAARIDLLACARCSHRELTEFPGASGVPEF
jgi:hypothetical protein